MSANLSKNAYSLRRFLSGFEHLLGCGNYTISRLSDGCDYTDTLYHAIEMNFFFHLLPTRLPATSHRPSASWSSSSPSVHPDQRDLSALPGRESAQYFFLPLRFDPTMTFLRTQHQNCHPSSKESLEKRSTIFESPMVKKRRKRPLGYALSAFLRHKDSTS